MKVLFTQGDEELVLLVYGTRGLYCRNVLDDTGFLFRGEQVGDLAVVEDVADLLHHALSRDLGVREEEHSGFLLQTGSLHEFLHLLHPIFAVYLRILILEGYICAQHGQTLPATPTNPHQQRMPKRRRDDPHNLDDMLDGSHEQDQIHPIPRIEVIILIQILIALLLDQLPIGQLTVHIVERFLRRITIGIYRRDETRPQ